jgi:hypothetical protein
VAKDTAQLTHSTMCLGLRLVRVPRTGFSNDTSILETLKHVLKLKLSRRSCKILTSPPTSYNHSPAVIWVNVALEEHPPQHVHLPLPERPVYPLEPDSSAEP